MDLDTGDDAADRAAREVSLHARFRHPHLLPLLAAFVASPPCDGDEDASLHPELWLVMPRAASSARELLETTFPSGLPPATVAAIVAAVAEALAYLHASRAVHRDVKAANVLLGAEGDVWLSDLGAANARELTASVIPSRHGGRLGSRLASGGTPGSLLGGSSLTTRTSGAPLGSRGGSATPTSRLAASHPDDRDACCASTGSRHAAAALARVESARYTAPELVATLSSTSAPQLTTPRPSSGPRAAAALLLQRYTTFAGTPAAMAPEVVEQSAAGYGPACDVYSLGVLMLELASGRNPYASLPLDALYVAKLHAEPPNPAAFASSLPPDAAALVAACMARDPAARPSAASVCRAPWVAGGSGRAGDAAVRAALAAAAALRVPAAPASAGAPTATPLSSDTLTPTRRGSSLRALWSVFGQSRSPGRGTTTIGRTASGSSGGVTSGLGSPRVSLALSQASPGGPTTGLAGTPPPPPALGIARPVPLPQHPWQPRLDGGGPVGCHGAPPGRRVRARLQADGARGVDVPPRAAVGAVRRAPLRRRAPALPARGSCAGCGGTRRLSQWRPLEAAAWRRVWRGRRRVLPCAAVSVGRGS